MTAPTRLPTHRRGTVSLGLQLGLARGLVLAAAMLGAGCRSIDRAASGDPASPAPTALAPAAAGPVVQPSPSNTPGAGGHFGAPLDPTLEPTPLARIVESPEAYRDRRVRTTGTVAQVCQRMGCWMELRGEDGPVVRVPMAGHAFFLPKDAAGRTAELEGTVRLTELSAAMREHLESEGAEVTGDRLSIEATGVVLRGPPSSFVNTP